MNQKRIRKKKSTQKEKVRLICQMSSWLSFNGTLFSASKDNLVEERRLLNMTDLYLVYMLFL